MLNLIVGKPGAGKSYYLVYRLYKDICDIVDNYIKTGDITRQIYSNVPLNKENILEQLKKDGYRVFNLDFIHIVSDDFFSGFWWDQFPDGSLIVVDEVQFYLSNHIGKDKEGELYLQRFEEWVSTHRHKQQDIYFLTQHPDNVQKSVLNMAEGCYQIQNIKNKVIPYLGIPMADLDVVREAFGSRQQWIHIIFGLYVGRAFKKESVQPLLLEQKYFQMYRSHFKGESDRPAAKRSRTGAVVWFVRRHFWHLSLKALCVYFGCWMLIRLITVVPLTILKTSKKSPSPIVETTNNQILAQEYPISNNQEGQFDIVAITPDYIILSNGMKVKKGEKYNGQILKTIDCFSGSVVWLPIAAGTAGDPGR